MKEKNKKKIRKIIYIIIIIMIFSLLSLIAIQLNLFEKKEIKIIEIPDECALMAGGLIHQIKNQGNCRLMCINECNLRELDFINSEFIEKINSCHECYCSCR